mmetsp:Transcript_31670/g.41859  ORF Transcript_31670/g.41859 Transcript_31670/m.41859 type:complete len:110 (-) Transcript_31670:1209-1538(-)
MEGRREIENIRKLTIWGELKMMAKLSEIKCCKSQTISSHFKMCFAFSFIADQTVTQLRAQEQQLVADLACCLDWHLDSVGYFQQQAAELLHSHQQLVSTWATGSGKKFR